MNRRLLFVVFITLSWNGAVALACQVPVFRYALERWEADAYEVVVFHHGELADPARTLVQKLRDASAEERRPSEEQRPTTKGFANLVLGVVDLATATPTTLKKAGPLPQGLQLPALVVRYPSPLNVPYPVWSGQLTEGAVSALVDSPARQEIARRLVGGDSVVWVLIESGDSAADGAAFESLQMSLSTLEKKLKLPGMEEITSDPEYQPDVPIELALRFSATRIARNDPAEALFVAMLMGIEADLKEFAHQPIAVPIFGRGRALYGLTGKGINADTIEAASRALIGPCSCTVKELNPGVDLLMAVDWNHVLQGEAVPTKPVPQLPAFASVEPAVDGTDEEVATVEDRTAVAVATDSQSVTAPSRSEASSPEPTGLWLPMTILVLLGLGFVAVGSLIIRRQGQKGERTPK
jgi:hypothetical protein